jgi:hypothetical protein
MNNLNLIEIKVLTRTRLIEFGMSNYLARKILKNVDSQIEFRTKMYNIEDVRTSIQNLLAEDNISKSNKEKLIYFLDLTNPSKIVKVDFTENLTLSEKIKKAQIDAEALRRKTLHNREENIKKIEEVIGSKINI